MRSANETRRYIPNHGSHWLVAYLDLSLLYCFIDIEFVRIKDGMKTCDVQAQGHCVWKFGIVFL